MGMTTVRFEEVSQRVERKGQCPVCGKRRTRSQTFTNTVNPFNKNADGEIKTRREVLADVRALGEKWVPDFSCNTHAPEEVCAATEHKRSTYSPRCQRCRADLSLIDATGGE